MNKETAVDFYLKIIAWIFFCLIVAGVCDVVKFAMAEAERSDRESSALQMIQKINLAQVDYAKQNNGKFAKNFDELRNLGEPFSGEVTVLYEYSFQIHVSEPVSGAPFFSISADPIHEDDAAWHFYYDSTLQSVKVTEENRQALPTDPSI